ncbi:mucin-binding protein [Lacticaseibacillus kribbianus]|uniref:mucin-binding protein n=1 Tax=Lacticaseibacillus kribbianus TaxID=2926292 RepID=UPI001CD3A2F0|nr:LPXTG cell wall anchor domain-containing protein [Lacticaseibacillus kribbianus]
MSLHSSTHLKNATTERKSRFKLYKSGKFWLIAGTAIGIWLAEPHQVSAAEATPAEDAVLKRTTADLTLAKTVPLLSSVTTVSPQATATANDAAPVAPNVAEPTPSGDAATASESGPATTAASSETVAASDTEAATAPSTGAASTSTSEPEDRNFSSGDAANDDDASRVATKENPSPLTTAPTSTADSGQDESGPDRAPSSKAVTTAAGASSSPSDTPSQGAPSPQAVAMDDGPITQAEDPATPGEVTPYALAFTDAPAWDAKVLTGTATPGNTVRLWNGGYVATATVGADGNWAFNLESLGLDLTNSLAVREDGPSGGAVGVTLAPYYKPVTHRFYQRDGMKPNDDNNGNLLDQFEFNDYVLITGTATLSGDTVNYSYNSEPNYYWPPLRHEDYPVIDGMVAQWRATPERVSAPNVTMIEAVYYFPATITVSPNATADDVATAVTPKDPGTPVSGFHLTSPNYPAGVTASELTKTVTRTIHFVNEDGDTVAPDITQPITYFRDGIVNFGTDPGTITYTPWRAADPVWEAVTSPSMPNLIPGTTTVEAVTTTGDTGDEEVTVTYFPQLVDFEGPKVAGSPVSTNPDDPRKYPEGMTPADSYLTKTRTIVLINAVTGESFNEDIVQPITFVRRGTIDFGQTPPTIGNITWWANDIQWGGVVAPAKPGMIATPAQLQAETVYSTSPDVTAYIRYYPSTEVVTSENPKNEGDKVGLDDEDPREYPAGLTLTDLKQTITRNIIYVNQDGDLVAPTEHQEVSFTRTGTVDWSSGTAVVAYSAWTPVDTTFEAVDSPIVSGLIPAQAVTEALPVNPGEGDSQVTVIYYPDTVTVPATDPKDGGTPVTDNPDDPREYPNDVGKADLNRTITRTVTYVTPDGTVLETATQPVIYTRDATVHFNADGSSTTTYTEFTTTDALWPALPNPEIPGWVAGTGTVEAVTTDADTADTTVTITYYPDRETVTADAPKNPGDKVTDEPTDPRTFPAGVTASDLSRTITRTITFVNGETGDTVADAEVQEVTYSRDALVIFGAGGTTVSYGAWKSKDAEWPALTSPDVAGLMANPTTVEAITTDQDTTSATVTVRYYPSEITVTPSQPKNPGDAVNPDDPEDNRVFPDGVKETDLKKDVARTIEYRRADTRADLPFDEVQTVHYTRTASVNLLTGAVTYGSWTTSQPVWTEAGSPTYPDLVPTLMAVPAVTTTGDRADETVVVLYYPAIIPVTPDDPKNPGDLVDPENPEDNREFPAGVTYEDLHKTVTRTITYVDLAGKTVADPVIQPVAFTRTAEVNLNAGVTYGDWVSEDPTWEAVESPSVKGLVTFTTVVAAQTIVGTTAGATVVVTYHPTTFTVTPDQPKMPGDKVSPGSTDDNREYPTGVDRQDLNRTVTRTIRFLARGGQALATPVVQRVTFSRTATVTFAADGGVTVTYSEWQPTSAEFAAYNAPAIKGYTARQPQVPAATVTVTDLDGQVVVRYLRNPQDSVPPTPEPEPEPEPEPKAKNPTPEPMNDNNHAPAPMPLPGGQRAGLTAQNDNTTLPQTGDATNPLLSLVGLTLSAAMGLLALAGVKRRRDENRH